MSSNSKSEDSSEGTEGSTNHATDDAMELEAGSKLEEVDYMKELPNLNATPRTMTELEEIRLESLLRDDEIMDLNEIYGHYPSGSTVHTSPYVDSQIIQRSLLTHPHRQTVETNRSTERRDGIEALLTLTPDNPLMTRFQRALKQHLLRQNEKLKAEITELNGEIKLKEKEAEERGVEVTEKLQRKRKQYDTTEECKQMLAERIHDRNQANEKVKNAKNKLRTISEILQDNEKDEESLRVDTVSMKDLLQRLNEYELEQTSELKVSQRISEKTAEDIRLFLNQKQKQDIIMFKLTNEILRLENLLKEIEQKSKVKRIELEEICQAIAEGAADVEVVQIQNKQILQIWNRMLIEIQHKNETFTKVQTARSEAEGQFSVLCAQVDSYARDSKKEMKLSQELTEKLKKSEATFEKLQSGTIEQIKACQKSDSELKLISNNSQIIKQELAQINSRQRNERSQLLTVAQKITRMKDTKFTFEEEILELLQTKTVNNKSILIMRKKIQEISQKISKQEAYSAKLENNVTRTILDVEIEKGALKLTKGALEDMRKVCENKENELRQLEFKLKQTKDAIRIASSKCVERAKKLEILKEHNRETSGCHEEEKVKALKKNIAEIERKTDNLKQSWLRKQNETVLLAQKRNKQVHTYNTVKKQLLILEQKNLKNNYNLELKQNQRRKNERSIKLLLLKIGKLNEQFYNHQTQVETMDANNYVTHNQYSGELKDAEESILGLTKEIEELETEKEEMSQTVVTLQQEFLIWEKKGQMIAEARQKLLQEQAAEGEIGTMKGEIHRMQVRYGQLLKAQEKLGQDMEMCIVRRDGIIDEALGREKRDKKAQMRHQLLRKIDDLRGKTKHILMETKGLEKECQETEDRKKELEEQLSVKQDQLNALKKTTQQMEDQLQEGQLHRQKNLELLVRKQRKGRQYADIKTGKYKPLFLNETTLHVETQRQLSINMDLISVVECLLTDFPPLMNQLTKILNTLRLPCS